MKKDFYTPSGIETRELSDAEVAAFAAKGDEEAKRVIARKKINAAGGLAEVKAALDEWLA